jgi:site-specific DNA recombinase
VRSIFELYLRWQTLSAVVDELCQRGWVNKRWRTRKGHERGGKAFTRTSLHLLLTNVLYLGQVKHKGAVHPGEHPAIVAQGLWQQVQDLLRHESQGSLARDRYGSLLKGLLHCLPCGCPMTPTYATSNGSKRYRYYLCTAAQKGGRSRCPTPSLAAAALDQVVLTQLKELSQDCPLVQALLDEGWPALAAAERARVLRVLVERVDYDGSAGKLVLALHPRGQQRLAEQLQESHHDVAAY